ncbi:MAG: EcsC family protein [Candidatus Electrothrix sp.]
MIISRKDLLELTRAKELLERDSIAIKLATLFCDVAEKIVRCCPPSVRQSVENSCVVGLEKTWELAMTTMGEPEDAPKTEQQHCGYAIWSGALGGAGIVTLFAELPVTTIIMMRAVADVARSEGEDFRCFDTKIACLQAFALGGDITDHHTGTTGYYASRILLEKPLGESTRYIAKKGAAGMGAPFAVQLAAKISVKYQTWLSAKAAAGIVPVAGAAMGAAVNVVYINYVHEKARGHFIVRRLERKYGAEAVLEKYAVVGACAEEKKNAICPPSDEQINKIIKRHMYAAMGGGLLPFPLLDFLTITGIQVALLMQLAKKHHITFSTYRIKNLIGALLGGAVSTGAGIRIGRSLAKMTPGFGQTVVAATTSATAGASTYAIGKVFHRHFVQGGTFLTFDPEKSRVFYEEVFSERYKSCNLSAHLKTG